MFSQLTTPSFLPWNTLSYCLLWLCILLVFLPISPACLPLLIPFHPFSEFWYFSGFSPSFYTSMHFLGDIIPIIFYTNWYYSQNSLSNCLLRCFISCSNLAGLSMHCCFLVLSHGSLVFLIAKKGPLWIQLFKPEIAHTILQLVLTLAPSIISSVHSNFSPSLLLSPLS